MRFWKEAVMVGVISLCLAGTSFGSSAYSSCDEDSLEAGCTIEPPGYYDGYDDSQAHPLRLVAYAIHPVGYAVEWLVTRPIHAIVSQPELQRVFGHQSHRWDFCCGMPQQTPTPAPTVAPVVHTEDVEAARRAAEEARRAAEEAKRAAEEAAQAAEKSTRGFEKTLTK